MKPSLVGGMAVLFLGACASNRIYDMNPKKIQTNEHLESLYKDDSSAWVNQAGTFKKALQTASAEPTNANNGEAYLRAGIAVSDLYCRTYFQKLSEQHADQQALRDSVNIVDAISAAALGLAGASADTVAISGVGFSSIESWFDTLDAAYLVSPNVDQVEGLVFKARGELYSEILSDPENLIYHEAERRLAAYHQLCTFNGVTRLVNQSIAKGEPKIQRTGADGRAQTTLNLLAAQPSLKSLNDLMATKGSQLALDDAVVLYAYYFLPYGSESGIGDAVEGQLSGRVSLTKKTLADYKNTATPILARIDGLVDLKSQAKAWIDKISARATKVAELRAALEENSDVLGSVCDKNQRDDVLSKSDNAAFASKWIELKEMLGEDALDTLLCPEAERAQDESGMAEALKQLPLIEPDAFTAPHTTSLVVDIE